MQSGGTHTAWTTMCGYCSVHSSSSYWPYDLFVDYATELSIHFRHTHMYMESLGKSWVESIRRFIIYSNGRPLDD